MDGSSGALDTTGAAARPDPTVTELVRRAAEANAALMRGDAEAYRALQPWSDDFTLMSPFGGPPSRAADYTAERIAALHRIADLVYDRWTEGLSRGS